MVTLTEIMNREPAHKKTGCTKTKARRLYIREYDPIYKKQVFKDCGVICLTCTLVILIGKVSLGLGNIGKPHLLNRQERRRHLRAVREYEQKQKQREKEAHDKLIKEGSGKV